MDKVIISFSGWKTEISNFSLKVEIPAVVRAFSAVQAALKPESEPQPEPQPEPEPKKKKKKSR